MFVFQTTTSTFQLPPTQDEKLFCAIVEAALRNGAKLTLQGTQFDFEEATHVLYTQKAMAAFAESERFDVLSWLLCVFDRDEMATPVAFLEKWSHVASFKLLKKVWYTKSFDTIPSNTLDELDRVMERHDFDAYYNSFSDYAESYLDAHCDDEVLKSLFLAQDLEKLGKELAEIKERYVFDLGHQIVIF